MAWNGRNVSILGAKAEGEAQAAAPSKEAENTNAAKASEAKKAAPAPPAPSVWNGRHQKIIAVREASSAVSPSPADASVASNDFSKKEQLVVSSSPKDIKAPVLQGKEDETTNSTAGSSRSSNTNTTIEDQNSVEVKVVTTGPADSEKKDLSEEKKDTSTSASDPVRNRQNVQARNAPNGGANAGRRPGNSNIKGGRNNNQGNSNNGRHNSFSRGTSGGGGHARRRVTNNNGDKPVCSFFLRGMCTRGLTCAFKHELAYAPNNTNPSSNPVQTSGTCPPTGNPKYTTPFISTKRTFDPNKARAIQLAKEAQDQEDRSRFASTVKIIQGEEGEEKKQEAVEELSFFSIDVECIATGYGSCAKGINDGVGNEGRSKEGVPAGQYNDRSHRYPGRIAMVDSEGALVTDIVIRPPQDGKGVISYLTPLTGLTSEMCLATDAKSLEEAVDIVKGLLPKNSVLVGQAIDHDVEWLGLVPGRDFERMVDISDIFRQRMPAVLAQAAAVLKAKEEGTAPPTTSDDKSSDEYLGFATRYRHFSLRHVSLNLLGTDIQSGVHNPITDAQYSLMLFNKYRNVSTTQLRIVRDGLHRAPITPGFAAENTPVIDGVCVSAMGYPYKRAARTIWRWYSANKQASS